MGQDFAIAPKPKAKPKGDRSRADDRRDRRHPLGAAEWPAGAICRTDTQRMRPAGAGLGEWERADLWLSLWRAFLKDLDEAQQLD